jgi:glutamate synthase (NADPH) small chain
MFKILSKKFLSESVFQMDIEAPLIAKSRKAGHFIILRVDEHGERIPLTISGSNTENGTIRIIVQKIGLSTLKLSRLNEGESIHDLVGPLGNATHIARQGTILCAGGGVGIAPLLPIAQALKAAGNKIVSVLAARNKSLIILEEEMRATSDEVIVMTDDGSYGNRGLVTHGMEEFITREKINEAVVIGPAIMMKFASQLTKKYSIPTMASLNSIMVDGTGMCGACRVSVGGTTQFVCVDGPEFDAHQVDFDELLLRLGAYRDLERKAMIQGPFTFIH